MKHVDVVILYEKAVRELDVACLIKLNLEKRYGLSVEIIQQNYGSPRAFVEFRPRVVVLPFCYQARSNNAYLIRWRDAVFFNMTWEQLFYPGNEKAKTPAGDFALRHVIHHAWSRHYADLLHRQGVPEEHVFLNGNPAYALYEEPYRRYFKSRAVLAGENGLNPESTWVFFPENFNWAFYEETMLRQMIQDGQSEAQVRRMRDFSMKSFETAMRWCSGLSSRSDVVLLLRPRPATPVEVFRKRTLEVLGAIPDRLRIFQRDSVRDWILASDLVVSSYSTSLIEASVAGVAAFMVEPYDLPADLRQEWHSLLPHMKTEEEFVSYCTGGHEKVHENKLGTWARNIMMGNGDSIMNLVDYLARICRGEVAVPARAHWRTVTIPGLYPLPQEILYPFRRLKTFFGKGKSRDDVEEEYRGDVNALAALPLRLDRWNSILAPPGG
jgi:surface carbohydrate biosynthesis protein